MSVAVNTELGSSRDDAARSRDLRFLASPLLSVALIGIAIAQQASGHIDSDVSWFLTLAEKFLDGRFSPDDMVFRNGGIAQQRVGEAELLRQRDVARMLHHVMRLAAAEMRRQAHHHRLGHDQPVRHAKIAPHALRIDHHAFGYRAGVLQRAVRQHECLRQREQFRLPRSGRALVVRGHRAEHHRHQRMHGARGGEDVFAGDRVALLRHRRG